MAQADKDAKGGSFDHVSYKKEKIKTPTTPRKEKQIKGRPPETQSMRGKPQGVHRFQNKARVSLRH